MTTEPTPSPVAYVISAIAGIADEATVRRYAELTGPAIERFGGRFIVSNAELAVVETMKRPPKRSIAGPVSSA